MSIDWAAVRFPDGDVRFTIHALDDTIECELGPDLDAVWRAGRSWGGDPRPEGETFEVDIYSNYDAGTFWRGRAARNCLVDGESAIPEWGGPAEREIQEGKPEWLSDALRARGLEGWLS